MMHVDGDGFIDLCTIFPYLGSKISSDCTDDADIDNRIMQASKMFSYLRKKVLRSKRITNATKKLLYESYVIHPTLRQRALAAQRGVAR